MPRELLRSPDHDRNRSLGWLSIAWIEHFVRHGPGAVQGQPISHGDEFTGFVVDCYALSAQGRMLYDSGFFSRPKGCNKSGLGAELVLFDGFGPSRFAGFARGGETYRDPWGAGFKYVYQPGEPMGKQLTAPFIRIMATEETQTGNVYRTVYFNLTDDDCPLYWVPGKDVGVERVLLPGGGEIRTSTASAAAKDGGLESFVVYDESHIYNTPELREMYATVNRNLRKRKRFTDTWALETTTMFAPDENSVAKGTYGEALSIREGRKKRGRARLLYDHRWGECEDLADEEKLRQAITEAFGEAMEWNDLDGLVDEFYDTRVDPQKSRRYFLNSQTSTSDSWLSHAEWTGCKRPDRELKTGDMVCLGMDGSVNEDSTAVCAVRVEDGHIELLGCWQRPDGVAGDGWQVDREDVDACVARAMKSYEVVGFFADPPHWQDYCDRWHNEWADTLQVKATERRPIEWWTNRPRAMVAALERFHEAVLEKRVSYTPSEDRIGHEKEMSSVLTTHALNARRRPSRSGMQIGKETPSSRKKIDALMAAVLAYEAAAKARAMGVEPRAQRMYVAKRIR